MHKGIPVEYCSGSSKYANLFGVSLSLLLRDSPINALGVWEDTESQSHISLDGDFWLTGLPNRCFPSVASAGRGITGALDLMTPTLPLRNISSAGLRLRPMPPCAGGKAVFTERTKRKNTKESCRWPWGCSHPRTLVRPKLGI